VFTAGPSCSTKPANSAIDFSCLAVPAFNRKRPLADAAATDDYSSSDSESIYASALPEDDAPHRVDGRDWSTLVETSDDEDAEDAETAGPHSRWHELLSLNFLKLQQQCNLSRRQLESVLRTSKATMESLVECTKDIVLQREVEAMPTTVASLLSCVPLDGGDTGDHVTVWAVCGKKGCEKVHPLPLNDGLNCVSCGDVIAYDINRPKFPLSTMSLLDRLQSILQVPGVEKLMRAHLAAVRKQLQVDPKTIYDILGGAIAQQLLQRSDDDNVLLLLGNLDWFAPNKQHVFTSYGGFYFTLCNLPVECRMREAYVLCSAVMPWLGYENKHLSDYLRPMVDDLLKLQDGVILKTYEHPNGRFFFGFTVGFACDVPV